MRETNRESVPDSSRIFSICCELFQHVFWVLKFHTKLKVERALKLTANRISLATHKSKYFNVNTPFRTLCQRNPVERPIIM